MQNPATDIKNMDFTSKIFSCVRLIDSARETILFEQFWDSGKNVIPEFSYSSRQELYRQCLQSSSVLYKLEQQSDNTFFVAILPEGSENRVIECIANISGSMEQIIQCNLTESAYLLSVTDELTRLYNRRFINQSLPREISYCAEHKRPLSLIFVDLDHFKDINDFYGHEAGDHFLSLFADFLQRTISSSKGWVARYGGDEFLLCLIGSDRNGAKKVANEIRELTEKMVVSFNNHKIRTTCSLGIYTTENFSVLPTSDSLIKEADKQLYKAKNSGRNIITI